MSPIHQTTAPDKEARNPAGIHVVNQAMGPCITLGGENGVQVGRLVTPRDNKVLEQGRFTTLGLAGCWCYLVVYAANGYIFPSFKDLEGRLWIGHFASSGGSPAVVLGKAPVQQGEATRLGNYSETE
ncbi:unnamed protein product [Parascedosporium putredinis]|uniref:Uncharacterized protein n=1 Tax=Parascedosporium putredinis TaxID=1442378 RepID=A0A9P1MDV8_9PEZI|nr:unnamed protein product [Parascedosporium putredinis]CAI8004406.1 unnamed protein product [Parascedosporium putredinis]